MFFRLLFWIIIIAAIYFAYTHFMKSRPELAAKISSMFSGGKVVNVSR